MLQKKVESKQLLPDDHQLEIAKCLESLYQRIQTYEPVRSKESNDGISSWFSFGKKKGVAKVDMPPAMRGL